MPVRGDVRRSAAVGEKRRIPRIVRIAGIALLLVAWPLFRPIYKTDPKWQWLAAILYWGWLAFLVAAVIVGSHH